MVRWMDGWMDGWMDRQTDGEIKKCRDYLKREYELLFWEEQVRMMNLLLRSNLSYSK